MNYRITRRRFGQLAIAGTAVAGITYLANKTVAQTPNLVVVGASFGSLTSSDNTTATVLNTTEIGSETTDSVKPNLELLLPSLNVATAQVQTPSPVQGVNIQSDEILSGFTSLNGTLILAVTPASTSNKGGDPTRLIFLSTPSRTVTVSGLQQQEKLESLLGTNDGKLFGLVVRKSGRPPVKLVEINVQTGAITSSNNIILPNNERFSTLAQCPDGKLYTTSVGRRGETNLVLLDRTQQKPGTAVELRFEGTVWNNGLQSLVCTNAGQLLAFGARRYETPYKLYTVNPSNGEMSLLTEFDTAVVTIVKV